jgi:ribosome-associated toxin RatA of RatAB toxin-antitoxin module
MFDRDDATEPFSRMSAEEEIETLDLLESRVQTATLPVSARDAYELFCDVQSIRNWVSVVSSVRVLERHASGRAARVAFMGRLEGASIGYTLQYRYFDSELKLTWTTARSSSTRIVGRSYFLPLGDTASLMHYELSLDLPAGALPTWEDPFFSANAASAVVNDFRDYIHRKIRG